MEGPRDYHTRRSKSERVRQIPQRVRQTYVWKPNYETNEHTIFTSDFS